MSQFGANIAKKSLQAKMPDLIHMHIKCIKLFSKLLVIKEPQGLKVPDVTKLLGEFRE